MPVTADITATRAAAVRSDLVERLTAAVMEAGCVYDVAELQALTEAMEAHVGARRSCAMLALSDAEASPLRAALLAGIDPTAF